MCKVRIGERILTAKVGERLGDLLRRYGIEAPHPCAGRGVCQKCRALADGKEILTCQYIIEGDVTVVLPERGGLDVTVLTNDGDFSAEGLFFALDIGTTTLCLSLAEKDGKELGRVNAQNPQIVFGADVISRIEHCT